MRTALQTLPMILAIAAAVSLPSAAEDDPAQLLPSLQAAYDQNGKAMADGDIDAFMALYAEDFVGVVAPDTTIDRDQLRDTAAAEMRQSPRPRTSYTVEKVEFAEGGSAESGARAVVASVLRTVVSDASEGQGKKGRKSLKVRYRDTIVQSGRGWQVKSRIVQ